MDHVDVLQDTLTVEQIATSVVLIVQNVIMNLFVIYVKMDLLIFTKEVADVQMDFGMMERSVKIAEIIVLNV